jgi:hypothetical protein
MGVPCAHDKVMDDFDGSRKKKSVSNKSAFKPVSNRHHQLPLIAAAYHTAPEARWGFLVRMIRSDISVTGITFRIYSFIMEEMMVQQGSIMRVMACRKWWIMCHSSAYNFMTVYMV